MKKLIYLAMAMLFSTMVVAQNKNKFTDKKGYFAFSGGLAIPVGEFASTSTANGGLAMTGFNANLHGGYAFTPHFGLGGNIFYATYTVNSGSLGISGVTMDHWQYYGVAVGPSVGLVKKERLDWTMNLYGGFARANSPVITYESKNTEETWATAFTLQLGTHLRYMTSPNTFVMGGLEYTGMKPRWTSVSTIGDYEQAIRGLHLSVGLGWKF